MIKQLRLKNWKSFEDSTLYVDPLTILIGTNASGKSNVLEALVFLQRVSSGIGIFPAINGDTNLPGLRGGIEWVCRKPFKEFEFEVVIDACDSSEYKYNLAVRVNTTKADIVKESLTVCGKNKKEIKLFSTNEHDSHSPAIASYFSTGKQEKGKRLDLNRSHLILAQTESLKLRKEIQDVAKSVLNHLRKIFVFDPIPSHMRQYSPLSDSLQTDGSNIAGVIAGLEFKRKEDVQQQLTLHLKGLPERDIEKVWTETVGRFETDAMIYCKEGWDNESSDTVDARGLSDGTLRYLGIATALLTREQGSLLVIEEVDNGLHPSRAHLLINMLRTIGAERNIDVLITTHNPAMLDAAGSGMIPFITVAHRDLQKGGTSVLVPLEDIDRLPKLMASGGLGQLSTEGRIETALQEEIDG
jgi:predicted ATPase